MECRSVGLSIQWRTPPNKDEIRILRLLLEPPLISLIGGTGREPSGSLCEQTGR